MYQKKVRKISYLAQSFMLETRHEYESNGSFDTQAVSSDSSPGSYVGLNGEIKDFLKKWVKIYLLTPRSHRLDGNLSNIAAYSP